VKTSWLLPLFALALYGADVSGKWTGSVVLADPTGGEQMNISVKAEFAQTGNAVTGTIGRAEDATGETIQKGKLDGKTLDFEAQPPEGSAPFQFHLVLTADDHLEGEVKGAVDVGNVTGKVVLTKVK